MEFSQSSSYKENINFNCLTPTTQSSSLSSQSLEDIQLSDLKKTLSNKQYKNNKVQLKPKIIQISQQKNTIFGFSPILSQSGDSEEELQSVLKKRRNPAQKNQKKNNIIKSVRILTDENNIKEEDDNNKLSSSQLINNNNSQSHLEIEKIDSVLDFPNDNSDDIFAILEDKITDWLENKGIRQVEPDSQQRFFQKKKSSIFSQESPSFSPQVLYRLGSSKSDKECNQFQGFASQQLIVEQQQSSSLITDNKKQESLIEKRKQQFKLKKQLSMLKI